MHNLLEFEQIDPERDLRLPQNIMSLLILVQMITFKACRQKKLNPILRECHHNWLHFYRVLN